MSKKDRRKNNPTNWVKPENDHKAMAWMEIVHSDDKWSTTTKKAEGFLQYLMDRIIRQMREEEIKLAAKEQRDPEEIPDVNVQLTSYKLGKRFVPFIAILDTTCIKSRSKVRNTNELGIFNPETSNRRTVRLKDPIFNYVIKPFVYTQKDVNAFFQTNVSRALGIETKHAAMLKQFREPRIQKFSNGRVEYVTVALDPIRLFSMMVKQTKIANGDSDDRFELDILTDSIERINSVNWKYMCTTSDLRNKNKKNKKFEDTVFKELERRVMGR